MSDEKAETPYLIYVLGDMGQEKAFDAAVFLEDQMSERLRTECERPLCLRSALFEDWAENAYSRPVGWFDLDNRRFIFIDPETLTHF
jgi:hypothetical protein